MRNFVLTAAILLLAVGLVQCELDVDEEDLEFDEAPAPPAPPATPATQAQETGQAAKVTHDDFEDEYEDDFADLPLDAHMLDPDEFEGADDPLPQATQPKKPRTAGATPTAESEAPQSTKNSEPRKPRHWSDFRWEMCGVAGVIAYVLNYFMGSRKNQRLADAWAHASSDLLKSNFAYIGLKKEETDDPLVTDTIFQILIQESASEFVLYACGRRNCQTFVADLELRGRHDLMSVISDQLKPSYDTLSIRIEMDPKANDGFVFCILPKTGEKKMKADFDDLRSLATTYPGTKWGLPENLCVLTDLPEVAPKILTEEVMKMVTKQKDMIEFIHFSDQFIINRDNLEEGSVPEPKSMLFFRFRLPVDQHEAIKSQQSIMRMSTYFIDSVAGLKLSPQVKKRSETKRASFTKEFDKLRNKQLATKAQEKRAAKKQAEREKMQAQGPEALAKYEEREKKRNMKKRMPKMKAM